MPFALLIRRYLRDLVFGAVDGAVTTFAIVAGAVGANLGGGIVLVLGVANLIADGFSMAVSDYLGTDADQAQPTKRQPARDGDPDPRGAALATFLAFVIVGAVPLLPFAVHLVSPSLIGEPLWPSTAMTALAFLGIGIAKARATARPVWRGAAETLVLGGGAASLAFVVGWLLRGVAQA